MTDAINTTDADAPTLGQEIYRNKNYKVIIGFPQATREVLAPWPCYLVKNLKTGVVENHQTAMFYAIDAADHLQEAMERQEAERNKPKNTAGSAPQIDFFN